MQKRTKQRIRIAAFLITVGMVLEFASLMWIGPSAFLVFIGGGAFICVGVGLYLFMLFIAGRKQTQNEAPDGISAS